MTTARLIWFIETFFLDEYPWRILLAQAKSLDDVTVAVDVALLEVSEQTTTLTNELSQ